jgi:Flp pilus assembly pilin Flp
MKLRSDERGVVLLEYVIVTAASLVIAIALLGLGARLVTTFGGTMSVLYSEYP